MQRVVIVGSTYVYIQRIFTEQFYLQEKFFLELEVAFSRLLLYNSLIFIVMPIANEYDIHTYIRKSRCVAQEYGEVQGSLSCLHELCYMYDIHTYIHLDVLLFLPRNMGKYKSCVLVCMNFVTK